MSSKKSPRTGILSYVPGLLILTGIGLAGYVLAGLPGAAIAVVAYVIYFSMGPEL